MSLRGQKILLTGPTGQAAFPLAARLAGDNEVVGLARFRDAAARERVESIGVQPLACDLASDDLSAVPDDFDIVLNFAVVKSGDFAYDLAANAEGIGRLMARCRRARAVLHVSSAAVYEYADGVPCREDAPLGDNHRVMFPTYSIAKIAAETVVRFAARQWNIPTTIARFSVPYGDNGGWPWFHLMMMKSGTPIPLHPDGPNRFNLIHEDDYIEQVPRLLEIADPSATTINWAGREPTAIEDWCAHLAGLTGLEPEFETNDRALGPLPVDTTRMNELVGATRVDWRDGLARMVAARNPELLGS